MRDGVCLIFSHLDVGLEKYITFFPQNFPPETSVPLRAQANPLQFHSKKILLSTVIPRKMQRMFLMMLYKISSLNASINMLALLAL